MVSHALRQAAQPDYLTEQMKMSIAATKLQIISLVQIMCYVVMTLPLRLLVLARREIDPQIRHLRRGSLVVANHQWSLDPFVVLGHLPFATFLSLLPIRFPVAHKFMKNQYWQWLRLFGCYDIGATPREKMVGLYRARQLLRHHVTVFLFPEGNVNRSGQVGELQRGIEFLVTENTPVMFVRLQGFHHRGRKFLFEPRSVVFSVSRSASTIKRYDIQKILQVPSPEY